MLFSEPTFLFWFLPIVVTLYYVAPRCCRNFLLAVASLLFYGWKEVYYLPVMLGSILFNYAMGLAVERHEGTRNAQRWLVATVIGNLLILGTFKYTNFLVDNLNALLMGLGIAPIDVPRIPLPVGVSFFTFQAMSYVIDVYRREVRAQRRLLDLTLYISFFPQLIAGPIVRYVDIARQLHERRGTWDQFALGIHRFVLGLGKKMILANTVALPADRIFALPAAELSPSVAWFGVLCYTLQIFLDFSAYSDMAIGLGRMFGFEFLENFDYPYIARTITAFWRRWHMSLSTWFRDYLYIPLGGNRISRSRTYFNLLIVFVLCGFWHGASWNFVLWGLYHGMFLTAERMFLDRQIRRWPGIVQHGYTLVVVMVGWVFFKAATLPAALAMLKAMLGVQFVAADHSPLSLFATPEAIFGVIAGVLVSLPIVPGLEAMLERWRACRPRLELTWEFARLASLLVILLSSALLVAADTYSPFIYYRF